MDTLASKIEAHEFGRHNDPGRLIAPMLLGRHNTSCCCCCHERGFAAAAVVVANGSRTNHGPSMARVAWHADFRDTKFAHASVVH